MRSGRFRQYLQRSDQSEHDGDHDGCSRSDNSACRIGDEIYLHHLRDDAPAGDGTCQKAEQGGNDADACVFEDVRLKYEAAGGAEGLQDHRVIEPRPLSGRQGTGEDQ